MAERKQLTRKRLRSKNKSEPKNLLDLIAAIKQGSLDPSSLASEQRRDIVQHLGIEGFSAPEIAKILNVTDRTIRRDRDEIRKRCALEHDPEFVNKVAGHYLAEAEAGRSKIRRIARERDVTPGVRIEGERVCFDILDRVLHRLQSLGYLPIATQHISADLHHQLGENMTLDEIGREAKRLARIEGSAG